MYMNKVVLQVLFVNCSCEGRNWLKPNTHTPVKNKPQTSKEKNVYEYLVIRFQFIVKRNIWGGWGGEEREIYSKLPTYGSVL